MEDDSSGDRNQNTPAEYRNFRRSGDRNSGLYDRPENGGKGGDDDEEGEEEECDVKGWDTLTKGFNQVQSVLDQNKALIQQVNENHQSKIPDNLAKNVALICEINDNISKVVSLYSDLSVNFSSLVHQHRETLKISTGNGNGNGKDGEVPGETVD